MVREAFAGRNGDLAQLRSCDYSHIIVKLQDLWITYMTTSNDPCMLMVTLDCVAEITYYGC